MLKPEKPLILLINKHFLSLLRRGTLGFLVLLSTNVYWTPCFATEGVDEKNVKKGFFTKDGSFIPSKSRYFPNGTPYFKKISPGADGTTYQFNDLFIKPELPKKPIKETPIEVPENAKLNFFGTDWECKHGFVKQGQLCEKLNVPENAKLDFKGTHWICSRGFRRQNDLCEKIEIPENAKLTFNGKDWECKKGYRQEASLCIKIAIPENAKLNFTGASWDCNYGYIQDHDTCRKVVIPSNAKLNFTGTGWECKHGYLKQPNSCIEISIPENSKLNFMGYD